MVMKLSKRSEEELELCRPGVGVIFMKVGESDIRSEEFYPSINGRLRTAPPRCSDDLHEWIDNRFQESKKKEKVVNE